MNNFLRAVRIALRYRWTLAGLLGSSLAVAILWGANLGTIYPILGVVLKQQSLPDWVDQEIAISQSRSQAHRARVVELRKQLENAQGKARRQLTAQFAKHNALLQAEQKALDRSRSLRPYIHRFLPHKPFATLVLVVCVLLFGTALKTMFLVFSVVNVERLTQLVAFELRKTLYKRTLRMNLAHFGQDRTATLLSHFTHDIEGITVGVNTFFGRALREPLKIVACLLGAAFVCWRLLLFCLIVTPIAIYMINRLAKSVKRANRRAMDEMAGVYNHLSESFNGIQVVKAFTMERFERRRMHLRCKDYLRKAVRIAVYDALTKPFTELMSIGVVGLAILGGGYLVLNQEVYLLGMRMSNRPLTFELLMTFFALLAGVSDPFRKLAEVYNRVQRGSAAADRVYQLIDRQPTVKQAARPIADLPSLDELTFQNLSFAYDPSHVVLENITVRVPAHQRIAIVGPNGCGKSSLVNLIPRFYDPVAGCVRWNEHDLKSVNLKQLRSKIGIVTQQTLLFDDSVFNNIRYGSPWASEAEVALAAKKAHAHHFILNKLACGYDTNVGQGGKLLSGGQRQRIALARAILRDPEILILDEATSQVDIESEQLIHQALQEFTAGRTTIMITHRLSTLSLADHIIVMDAGRIMDSGTHEELIDRCPLYRRLNQIHFRTSA